jgi:hypothetical protein
MTSLRMEAMYPHIHINIYTQAEDIMTLPRMEAMYPEMFPDTLKKERMSEQQKEKEALDLAEKTKQSSLDKLKKVCTCMVHSGKCVHVVAHVRFFFRVSFPKGTGFAETNKPEWREKGAPASKHESPYHTHGN